ncbi:MAG: Smr/MutS family protein, partial [Defluviitaleaceae bacterium]|nr:Smr/MutS family protein [Defluviitaleaceae bacterium]
PRELRKGDRVYVRSMGHTAIVSAPPDENGDVKLQAGIMKVKVNVCELSLDESEDAERKKAYAAQASGRIEKSMNITAEIDLRGMVAEDAVEKTDKYLDDAFLAGLRSVTIIHGKGTGALRNAVHAQLKNHPHVTEYRLGKFGEGEHGVTIAELK